MSKNNKPQNLYNANTFINPLESMIKEQNPTKDNPSISIVVINYNGRIYLEETIKAILDLDYFDLEVIVVDNGSTDGSVEFLEKLNGIQLVKSPKTGEKNHACNLGISKARGEYILLMDNDLVLVDKNILKELVHEAYSLPRCGSIGLAYVNRGSKKSEGYGCFTSLYYSWEKPNVSLDEIKAMHGKPVGSPNGAGIFIKKELWDFAGGYDDHLSFGGDDDDLGMRLWLYGYSNYLYSKSLQIHIGMAERTDTFKYSTKFQKKVYAHMYTIVKNFRPFNAFITLNGYIIFSSAKALKQSLKRKSIKPLSSTANGYLSFLKNIPAALSKRKEIQNKRVVKRDIFLKIRPAFTQKHSRFNVFLKIFK